MQKTVQDYSIDKRWTSEEFEDNIDSTGLKDAIANAIDTTADKIGTITFENNTLTISPKNSREKIVSNTNPTLISNGLIVTSFGLNFYNEIIISNLNTLQSAIQDYIVTNKYTSDNFWTTTQLNSNAFKTEIAKAINPQNGQVTSDSIGNISVSDNNTTLTIKPKNTRDKFVSNSNQNMIQSGQIVISNLSLSFWNKISFANNVLSSLRTSIINQITNRQITLNNIDSNFNQYLVPLINNTKTSNNVNLSNYISTPSYSVNSSSNTINITITLTGKNEFEAVSCVPGISVTSTAITLSDINLIEIVGYFIFRGNEIIGLTNEGKQQTRLVLPARATSIANNVFTSNKTIQSVNMSLTGIAEIPNGFQSSGHYIGLFGECSNLTWVSFPNSLTSIGIGTFSQCTSLTSVNIPSGVTTIGIGAFKGCSSLTLNIPNSVTEINYDAFGSVKQVNVPRGDTRLYNLVAFRYSGTIGYY